MHERGAGKRDAELQHHGALRRTADGNKSARAASCQSSTASRARTSARRSPRIARPAARQNGRPRVKRQCEKTTQSGLKRQIKIVPREQIRYKETVSGLLEKTWRRKESGARKCTRCIVNLPSEGTTLEEGRRRRVGESVRHFSCAPPRSLSRESILAQGPWCPPNHLFPLLLSYPAAAALFIAARRMDALTTRPSGSPPAGSGSARSEVLVPPHRSLAVQVRTRTR